MTKNNNGVTDEQKELLRQEREKQKISFPIIFPVTIEHKDPNTGIRVGWCKIPEPIDGNLVVLLSRGATLDIVDMSRNFIEPLIDSGKVTSVNFIQEEYMTAE